MVGLTINEDKQVCYGMHPQSQQLLEIASVCFSLWQLHCFWLVRKRTDLELLNEGAATPGVCSGHDVAGDCSGGGYLGVVVHQFRRKWELGRAISTSP